MRSAGQQRRGCGPVTVEQHVAAVDAAPSATADREPARCRTSRPRRHSRRPPAARRRRRRPGRRSRAVDALLGRHGGGRGHVDAAGEVLVQRGPRPALRPQPGRGPRRSAAARAGRTGSSCLRGHRRRPQIGGAPRSTEGPASASARPPSGPPPTSDQPPAPGRVVAVGEVLAPVASRGSPRAARAASATNGGDRVQVGGLPGRGATARGAAGPQPPARAAGPACDPGSRGCAAPPRRRSSSPATCSRAPACEQAAPSGARAPARARGGRPSARSAPIRSREDQSLEQRVGRQPVGAVHAGAGAPPRRRTGPARRCGRAGRCARRRWRSARPGATGIRSVTGSMPCARQDSRIVGNRCCQSRAPRCRASSQTCGAPVSRIRRMIAFATTSRGARSASACSSEHEPVAGRRRRGRRPRRGPPRTPAAAGPARRGPSHSTVGWNWTNSRSATCRAGPQRERHAVAGRDVGVGGLGEHLAEPAGGEHHGPAPARRRRRRAALAHHVQRHPGSRGRCRRGAGRARARSRRPRCPGRRATAASRAREISAPVASPPACAMRSRWWPPSRVRASAPSASWSKPAPRAISSPHRRRSLGHQDAAPPSTSHSPDAGDQGVVAGAARGSRPRPSAAAMPPCAQRVEPGARASLGDEQHAEPGRRAAVSAAVRPAIPVPTTTTSARVHQPGSGASRRVGSV